MTAPIYVLSDFHVPYSHPDWGDHVRDTVKQVKPEWFVINGDYADATNQSRFDVSPDAMGASDELAAVRRHSEALLKIIGRKIKLIRVLGNHEGRFAKSLTKAKLPAALRPDLNEVFGLPPGEWFHTAVIGEYAFNHGAKVGAQARQTKEGLLGGRSTVYGDKHALFGVKWIDDDLAGLFIASAGCLIDPLAPCFDYAWEFTRKACLGTLAIVDGQVLLLRMKPESIEKTRFTGGQALEVRENQISRYADLLKQQANAVRAIDPQRLSPEQREKLKQMTKRRRLEL